MAQLTDSLSRVRNQQGLRRMRYWGQNYLPRPRLRSILILLLVLTLVSVLFAMYRGVPIGAETIQSKDMDSFAQSILPSVFTPSSGLDSEQKQAAEKETILFIENVGQFEDGVLFLAHTSEGVLHLGQDFVWFTALESAEKLFESFDDMPAGFNAERTLQGTSLKLTFPGANLDANITPFDALDVSINYLQGSDPKGWHSDVPVWRGVRYENLYPDLDLVVTSVNGEWNWSLVPHEQPQARIAPFTLQSERAASQIRLRIEGSENLRLDRANVRANTVLGELSVPLLNADAVVGSELVPEDAKPAVEKDEIVEPFSEPEPSEEKSDVPTPRSKLSSLWNAALTKIGFSHLLAPQAEARPSALVYSTYLGNPGGSNSANAMDIGADGATYVGGLSFSSSLPITPGAFETENGDRDGFAAKFSSGASTLEYATYISGSVEDQVRGLATTSDGSVVLVGWTTSSDFPVTSGSYDTTYEDGDAFVLRLNSTGTGLVYSTFLGGSGGEEGMDVAVDASDAAYVTGFTTSPDFPVTAGAPQPDFAGGYYDGFVAKLSSDGSDLIYSSYFGGSNTDCEIGTRQQECAIAVDIYGAAYVGGPTYSEDFPVTSGAYQSERAGNREAFALKMSPAGDAFEFATYIGGSGDECRFACDISADPFGAVYLVGSTTSSDFPTTPGAWDREANGDWDGFAAKLSPDGSQLLYGTYFGGSRIDVVWTGSATRAGELFIGGDTTSEDFPTTSEGAQTCVSCPTFTSDAFLLLIGQDGSLSYSTFIGGSARDTARAMVLDPDDHVFLSGETFSNDFPTTPGVYQPDYPGNYSTFNLRIDVDTAEPSVIDLAASTVTVAVVDQDGIPLTDWPVSIETDGEAVNINPGTPINTDILGIATFELRSTVVQTVEVSARELVTNALLFDADSLDFVAGPTDPNASTITTDKTLVTADGIDFATLTITFIDAYGHPIVGHEVILRI
ncbi:MAG: Ig-like domain-containing protein, partial [Anaerolineales bacterium]